MVFTGQHTDTLKNLPRPLPTALDLRAPRALKRVPEVVTAGDPPATDAEGDRTAEIATPAELSDYDANIIVSPRRFGPLPPLTAWLPSRDSKACGGPNSGPSRKEVKNHLPSGLRLVSSSYRPNRRFARRPASPSKLFARTAGGDGLAAARACRATAAPSAAWIPTAPKNSTPAATASACRLV